MEAFRECGFPAFLVLALAIIAMVVGIVALSLAILKPRWGLVLSALALAVSCSVPGSGAAGTAYGRQMVEDAVGGESIDPSMRQRILKQGYQEAGQCTTLGVGFGALPLLLSLGALGVAFARRRTKPG
jgi:hypothetical protein